MTVTLDRPRLADALGLPGARAVSLLDPDVPAVLWSAGADAPAGPLAATVAALATAAATLVALTDPDDELNDIILTSTDAFHVLRLIGDGSGHVAHLTLHRAHANLAMARREFALLVAGYTARPRHAAAPPPDHASGPPGGHAIGPSGSHAGGPSSGHAREQLGGHAGGQPGGHASGSPGDYASGHGGASVGEHGPGLPRRERAGRSPGTAEEKVAAELSPDWFALINAPYATDDHALDRILVTLRSL